MNYEKMGYSLIGSLIAGSLIQKNMELAQHYFFLISISLWAVCITMEWWNGRKKEQLQNDSDRLILESREVIVKNILETISRNDEKKIEVLKEEIKELKKHCMKIPDESIEMYNKVQEVLLHIDDSIIIFHNNSLDNIKSIKEAVAGLEEVTGNISKEVCLKLTEQSYCIQELIQQKRNFISELNQKNVMKMEKMSNDIVHQMQGLQDNLEMNKKSFNVIIENEQKSIAASISEVISVINSLNNNTTEKMLEVYTGISGILSNLQSTLDLTENKLSTIQNNNNGIYGLLEDTNNKINDIEDTINEGANKIEDMLSQSMVRQEEIVTNEASILDSYNELLGRINDEVIAKMISDSDSLYKCMRDCYNLLDGQRREKR